MGIALNGLAALLRLHRGFGPLGATLQVGRQAFFIASGDHPTADALLHEHAIPETAATLAAGYADERFLPALGASPAQSIDASTYEGATFVQDFNDPVDETMHQRFDTLFDGGSLEHIFNVPQALANMMNMLKVGGRILHIVPANDWLGHGLYQFGPELFFRVYQPINGFDVHSVGLSHVDAIEPHVRFEDLGARGVRNEIGSSRGAAELIVVARKIGHVPPFRSWPQQGDYDGAWKAGNSG